MRRSLLLGALMRRYGRVSALCASLTLAAGLLTSPKAAAAVNHGRAVALGDFNASGGWQRDEVVIGAPNDNWGGTMTGSVALWWRTGVGADTWAVDWLSQDRLDGGLFAGASDGGLEDFDQFGSALAVGDFDKDGFKDLAIGVPGEDIDGQADAGCVHVLYGAARGPNGMPFRQNTAYLTRARAWPDPLPATPSANDQFGASLAAGDFDGNGFDDLAIGAPGVMVNGKWEAGAVFVFYSSGVDFASFEEYTLYKGGPLSPAGVAEDYAGYGSALAAGNFNGDLNGTGGDGTGPQGSRRIMDLAVSAPNQTVSGYFGAGDVTLYYGAADSNFSTTSNYVLDQSTLETAEPFDNFGYSLAAGDFNSDCQPFTNAIQCAGQRQDDLAIGVPNESVDGQDGAGLVHVLYGTPSGISLSNAQIWNSGNFTTAAYEAPVQAWANFGFSLAVGDVFGEPNGGCQGNTCNPLELVIGEPFRDRPGAPDSGIAYVLKGSQNQLLRADYSNFPIVDPWTRESDSYFGWALAVGFVSTAHGSVNSADVLVGAPGVDHAWVHFGDADEIPQTQPMAFPFPW